MGRLKNVLFNKIKASSLTEVIVATTILLVVFAITLVTLNNNMTSSVQKDTGAMETKIEKLIYEYKNNQLTVPISYVEDNFIITIQKVTENKNQFVEFSIVNSISKKIVTKKQFFYESE